MIFEKQPILTDKKCKKIVGARKRERVGCGLDTLHGKRKKRQDSNSTSKGQAISLKGRGGSIAGTLEIFHKMGEVQARETKAVGCSSRPPSHGLSWKNSWTRSLCFTILRE